MFSFIQVFSGCRVFYVLHMALAKFLLSLFLGVLPGGVIINVILHYLFQLLLSVYDDHPIILGVTEADFLL